MVPRETRQTVTEWLLYSSSSTETETIARRLAPVVEAGDTILLSGPIGSGKTVFARAFIKQRLWRFGLTDEVPSPTYTLIQIYQAGPVEIWHADLYRLHSESEIEELALESAMQNSICLIEWPDRLGTTQPSSWMLISFEQPNEAFDSRVLKFQSASDHLSRPFLNPASKTPQ